VGAEPEEGWRENARSETSGPTWALAYGRFEKVGRPSEARFGVDGKERGGVDRTRVPGEVRSIAGMEDFAAAGVELEGGRRVGVVMSKEVEKSVWFAEPTSR
jgi:hypothetical protein